MPIYYVEWEVEPTFTPQNPKDRIQLWITMTQWILADFSAGILKDWGRCSGELCGYSITNDVTPQQLDDMLLKYTPMIKFHNRTVLSAEENLESLKKAAKTLQP